MSPRDEDDKAKDDLDEFGIGGAARVEKARGEFVFGEPKFVGKIPPRATQPVVPVVPVKPPRRPFSGRAAVVSRVQPARKKPWTVPFGPAVVPPGQTVTVQKQPQVLFRCEHLINVGDEDDLYIQGLFVGRKSQLPSFQNPIPVSVYRDSMMDSGQLFDTCDPALLITFQISNRGTVPRTFAMDMRGVTVA
jgi:hypothetical protein